MAEYTGFNAYALNANARLMKGNPSVNVHSMMPGVHARSIFGFTDQVNTGYVALKPNGPLIGRINETIIEGQTPDNPGIKTATFSTYGLAIPVSLGRRFIAGNIIDASDLVPRLVGYREYYTEERVYPEDTGGIG